MQSIYNIACYNTDLDINGHVNAPIFFTMEFYKRIKGK